MQSLLDAIVTMSDQENHLGGRRALEEKKQKKAKENMQERADNVLGQRARQSKACTKRIVKKRERKSLVLP